MIHFNEVIKTNNHHMSWQIWISYVIYASCNLVSGKIIAILSKIQKKMTAITFQLWQGLHVLRNFFKLSNRETEGVSFELYKIFSSQACSLTEWWSWHLHQNFSTTDGNLSDAVISRWVWLEMYTLSLIWLKLLKNLLLGLNIWCAFLGTFNSDKDF